MDGVNVKEYTAKALHNKLGYVSQRAVMFAGTVESNVSYGDNGRDTGVDSEYVKKSVDIAQGTEFVEKMEDAYQGMVAQNGCQPLGRTKAAACHCQSDIQEARNLYF